MFYLPSVKRLISVSTENDFLVRDIKDGRRESLKHKIPITNLIDTISVKSTEPLKLLRLDWACYRNLFDIDRSPRSKVDTKMLMAIMETNITDYLSKLPFLDSIAYSKLETLVRMCRYQVKPEGSVICKEGEASSDVFFVLSGEVSVEAKASKRVVDLFGTSHSNDNTSGTGRFFQCLRGSSRQLDPDEVSYAHQFFFPASNDCGLADEGSSNDSTCDEDTATSPLSFRSNAKGRRSPALTRKFTSLDDIELARLGPGEYFGVMSTITELPRSATVTTTSKVLLASISRSDFRSFVKVSPALEPSIEYVAKGHMLLNLFQLKSPFLTQISLNQAKAMGERCSIQKFNQGITIFKEGAVSERVSRRRISHISSNDIDTQNAENFYFVYSGSLKVEKMTDDMDILEVGYLYSGDYFGELSIIANSTRVSTVTTTSKTILLSISNDDIHKCFEDQPQILAELVVRMRGNTVTLEELINHRESKECFTRYLKGVHGEENLRFYIAATSFTKRFKSMSSEEIRSKANAIFEKYFTVNSPDAINASHTIYKEIELSVKGCNFSKDMFSKPIHEIHIMLEKDLFARFKKSEIFSKLLIEEIRVYDEVDLELLA